MSIEPNAAVAIVNGSVLGVAVRRGPHWEYAPDLDDATSADLCSLGWGVAALCGRRSAVVIASMRDGGAYLHAVHTDPDLLAEPAGPYARVLAHFAGAKLSPP